MTLETYLATLGLNGITLRRRDDLTARLWPEFVEIRAIDNRGTRRDRTDDWFATLAATLVEGDVIDGNEWGAIVERFPGATERLEAHMNGLRIEDPYSATQGELADLIVLSTASQAVLDGNPHLGAALSHDDGDEPRFEAGDWVEAGSGSDYDRGTVLEVDGDQVTVGWRGAASAIAVRVSVLREYKGDDIVSDPWPK